MTIQEIAWYPIDLTPAEDIRHYITITHALNLVDVASGPGGGIADWHQGASLWTHRSKGEGPHRAGAATASARIGHVT